MQLLRAVEGILQRGGLGGRVWMRPYHILCCGPGAGLIEMVADCASIDQVKKRSGCEHLGEVFTRLYGPPGSPCLEAARRNFLASLVPYSLVTYVLQVRDRHNANILVDKNSHLIHIDFGYMLGQAPGGIQSEAPFKLPRESVDLSPPLPDSPESENLPQVRRPARRPLRHAALGRVPRALRGRLRAPPRVAPRARDDRAALRQLAARREAADRARDREAVRDARRGARPPARVRVQPHRRERRQLAHEGVRLVPAQDERH